MVSRSFLCGKLSSTLIRDTTTHPHLLSLMALGLVIKLFVLSYPHRNKFTATIVLFSSKLFVFLVPKFLKMPLTEMTKTSKLFPKLIRLKFRKCIFRAF